jgi:hypothetical protein
MMTPTDLLTLAATIFAGGLLFCLICQWGGK